MEEPGSPRSAAIYYWGGDWDGDDNESKLGFDHEAEAEISNDVQGWADESEASYNNYADLYKSTFQKRTSFQRRCCPAAVKFTLTLQDEGDADHWLYAPDLSFSPSAAEEEEEKVEEKVEETEPTTSKSSVAANNDFADPNVMGGGDFDSIPIVDLSQPKHVYARQIGEACRNVGFFYIINHGVEEEAMEGVLDKSKKFFGTDLESKLEVSSGKSGEKKGYRGYFEIGGEDLDNKDGTRDLDAEEGSANVRTERFNGDFKEGFDCGLEIGNMGDDDARIKFFGKNMWPNEKDNPNVAGFRETLMKYQAELVGLSDKLLLALGESLNDNPNGGDVVDDDYFITRTRNPMCTLRLLHYPPVEDGVTTSQGCGAHTDYGLFTILQQDSIGGLQVRNRNKRWVDAKPLKGSFVINVGDMLSHWTNGEYASTVHRVVSPSVSGDRYSVPFFYNPDYDTVVEPLNNGVDGSSESEGNGNAVSVGKTALEILRARYDGTFQISK